MAASAHASAPRASAPRARTPRRRPRTPRRRSRAHAPAHGRFSGATVCFASESHLKVGRVVMCDAHSSGAVTNCANLAMSRTNAARWPRVHTPPPRGKRPACAHATPTAAHAASTAAHAAPTAAHAASTAAHATPTAAHAAPTAARAASTAAHAARRRSRAHAPNARPRPFLGCSRFASREESHLKVGRVVVSPLHARARRWRCHVRCTRGAHVARQRRAATLCGNVVRHLALCAPCQLQISSRSSRPSIRSCCVLIGKKRQAGPVRLTLT